MIYNYKNTYIKMNYKINVSGKIYDVKHNTLVKIPYFLEFINSDEPTCFVERSSMLFDHVLAYAIDPLHPYPSKYFYELDFYGLIYDKTIYKINVTGKIYHIKSEILMKIPYFADRISKINTSSIELFVDRSPLLFDQILSYVVDDSYPLECYKELDYYGIIYKKYNLSTSFIHDISNNLDEETYKIKNKLDNVETKLENIENKFEDIITKLNEIKPTNKDNPCQYSGCDNYINDKDNLKYCGAHNECIYCCREAFRYHDYRCVIHK
jgi:hypothetical protein